MSDQVKRERAEVLISRRSLLASMGVAGVSLVAGSVLGSKVYAKKAADTAAASMIAAVNVADLKALSTTGLHDRDLAIVEGYYSAGDGGGGNFYWDAASTEPDNGGTVVIPAGYSGAGRWKRIIKS